MIDSTVRELIAMHEKIAASEQIPDQGRFESDFDEIFNDPKPHRNDQDMVDAGHKPGDFA